MDLFGRCLAEREGFEPSIHLRGFRFSRPVHSTTLPPLRAAYFIRLLTWIVLRDDFFKTAHIRPQCWRYGDTAIGVLKVFEHRHECAAHCQR